MKKRNLWAAFGISAAAAAVLLMAIVLISGISVYGTDWSVPRISAPQDETRNPDVPPPAVAGNGDVRITSLEAGDILKSPTTIIGEARGWYFEGSFPVTLKDADGKILTVGLAKAQDDWMSADFVPFQANLEFAAPATSTGTLVFAKDNPSGLPQYDAQFSIPVTFSAEAPSMPVGDCRPSGCSGQVCSDQDIGTTCEWNESYACYMSAKCARQADGHCGWTATPELQSCLEKADKR